MKTGIDYIKEERQSQIKKHGYTKEWHEKNIEYYNNNQLIQAAKFCIDPINEWPKNWEKSAAMKIINKDRIGQLACAGAFYMCKEEVFGKGIRTSMGIEEIAKDIDKLLTTSHVNTPQR